MEKEPQPESLATVTIKPDYPPSEVYSSEPPPAYHRSQSSAVQVAKIIAVTVVLVSVVLGSFILASAYITANASCRQLEQELELLTEAADRFQAPLQPEALTQDEPQQKQAELVQNAQESKNSKEIQDNNISQEQSESESNGENSSSESEDDDRTPIHIKLPLQLDFDDLAGALIEKNQRSRMNCIVEKKRAEEVVDHQPKTVRLPFGVNLTTDPRYEHLSGERMAIFCESGNVQSQQQQQQPEQEQEDTIMIQPVVIPLVGNSYATHMPQQAQQVQHQLPPQIQAHLQAQMQAQMQAQLQAQMQARQQQQLQQQQQHQMHPMETMRPPMPGPMAHQQTPQQSHMPPNALLQHIAQQIIAQRIQMDAEREQQAEAQNNDISQQQEAEQRASPRYPVPEAVLTHRLPIPEEVLTQINRLPNRDVIVAVQEQDSEEVPQELRIMAQARHPVQEIDERQTYARGIPVHIPVPMMQPEQTEQQQQQQQQQQVQAEEPRPHYVQPRSVRSVDALLPKSEKRVKRCACDCAC